VTDFKFSVRTACGKRAVDLRHELELIISSNPPYRRRSDEIKEKTLRITGKNHFTSLPSNVEVLSQPNRLKKDSRAGADIRVICGAQSAFIAY